MAANPRPLSVFNTELKLKGFNVFQIESDGQATREYSRKDFYKICLTTGRSRIHYADRSYAAEGTVLFFGSPLVPYSWETLSRMTGGLLHSLSFGKARPIEIQRALKIRALQNKAALPGPVASAVASNKVRKIMSVPPPLRLHPSL